MKRGILLALVGIFFITGCIHLVNEDLPKNIVIEQTQQATCPTCPTCPAPNTPTPTLTPVPPTSTPTSPPITVTPVTPTPTGSPTAFLYELQISNPVYGQNFTHMEEGCNWIGVSGQVFNKSNLPITNLVIHIWGKVGQKLIDSVALTGHPEGINYGPGGYEIILSDELIDTSDSVFIQLLDLGAKPLSAVYDFSTFDECDKNLIIINFVPVK